MASVSTEPRDEEKDRSFPMGKCLIFSESVCEGVNSKSNAVSSRRIAAKGNIDCKTFRGMICMVGYIIQE